MITVGGSKGRVLKQTKPLPPFCTCMIPLAINYFVGRSQKYYCKTFTKHIICATDATNMLQNGQLLLSRPASGF